MDRGILVEVTYRGPRTLGSTRNACPLDLLAATHVRATEVPLDSILHQPKTPVFLQLSATGYLDAAVSMDEVAKKAPGST